MCVCFLRYAQKYGYYSMMGQRDIIKAKVASRDGRCLSRNSTATLRMRFSNLRGVKLPDMVIQSRLEHKRRITKLARLSLVIFVYTLMLRQVLGPRERLVAISAFVIALGDVFQLVVPKVSTAVALIIALGALVDLSHFVEIVIVLFQAPSVGVLLIAGRALVLATVFLPDMAVKGANTFKTQLAKRTGMGVYVEMVKAQMSRQTAGR